MEIHEVTNAMLSNYEVLALLREQDQKRAAASRSRKGQPAPQTSKLPQNLLTVEFEVKKHLNRGALKQLTAEALHQLMLELAKFPLTKAEKLQIVNMRPASKVELHVIIEELDERFSPEDQEALIHAVTSTWKLVKSPTKSAPAAESSTANAAAAESSGAANGTAADMEQD